MQTHNTYNLCQHRRPHSSLQRCIPSSTLYSATIYTTLLILLISTCHTTSVSALPIDINDNTKNDEDKNNLLSSSSVISRLLKKDKGLLQKKLGRDIARIEHRTSTNNKNNAGGGKKMPNQKKGKPMTTKKKTNEALSKLHIVDSIKQLQKKDQKEKKEDGKRGGRQKASKSGKRSKGGKSKGSKGQPWKKPSHSPSMSPTVRSVHTHLLISIVIQCFFIFGILLYISSVSTRIIVLLRHHLLLRLQGHPLNLLRQAQVKHLLQSPVNLRQKVLHLVPQVQLLQALQAHLKRVLLLQAAQSLQAHPLLLLLKLLRLLLLLKLLRLPPHL